jgi:peptide-methionine (R)-S-oxide reductase
MNRRQLIATAAAGLGLGSLIRAVAGQGDTMATETTGDFEVTRTDAEWKRTLTPGQYYVLRKHDTEFAGSSPLLFEHRKGTFSCAGCGQPLFSSGAKYESGSGWPSFVTPLENAVATSRDSSLGMTRTEVHCRRCGGHLGHVFEDGPQPTGLRYCTNGTALTFTPEK